ncbi:putative hspc200 [Aspergillus steynii IBT 23096]|uniref:Putative hspc200 n=1 Tax=Aspergillus steynii IBT 23096 TaxID=1392250 RepID=A0A2I2GLR7_9EURO|nr:putative hspc200 [Aspergillus steynii IBT 23096]PLB53809.1 putative hspc200 [Aspergillus steynii IBT 23096]
MEILPPSDDPPIDPSEYPVVPTRTPLATLESMRTLCVRGDIQQFRENLDAISSSPGDFDICDFYTVMLLDRGLPMDPIYASQAVRDKAKDALTVFIQRGWDINQPMSELKPPVLGNAINDEMTAWLLDHGADPNRRCFIDLTPLSFAVECATVPIIDLMFCHGGDAQKGQLLHHALERQPDTIEVLKILMRKGAPINSCAHEDYPSWALFHFMGLGTALHKAAELGKVDVVRYLLSEGTDQSIRDANDRTALDCARKANQWQVIEVLEKGS